MSGLHKEYSLYIIYMPNKNGLGAVKMGTAKQSRINRTSE